MIVDLRFCAWLWRDRSLRSTSGGGVVGGVVAETPEILELSYKPPWMTMYSMPVNTSKPKSKGLSPLQWKQTNIFGGSGGVGCEKSKES